jgi:hypothetical protein
MDRKKIILIAPNPWIIEDLHKFEDKYEFIYLEGDFQKKRFKLRELFYLLKGYNIEWASDFAIKEMRRLGADAILGIDEFMSCLIANRANHKLGNPEIPLDLALTLQHKYYSRILQKKYIPKYVPEFFVYGEKEIDGPVFIKPFRGAASLLSHACHNKAELEEAMDVPLIPKMFYLRLLRNFEKLTQKYAKLPRISNAWHVEKLMEGVQVTLEGFVYQGKNTIIGVTDSIMYPNSKIAFRRFDYPSALPTEIQDKMHAISRKFIDSLDYTHGFYNIEFFYSPQNGEIKVIEINPRMAFQFNDLYEKVDGINTLEILLKMSVGEEVTYRWGEGKFKKASSFILRQFSDGYVHSIPNKYQIQEAKQYYPDLKLMIDCHEGKKLSSDLFQDTESFKVMTANIGEQSMEALERKYHHLLQLLPFEIERDYKEESTLIRLLKKVFKKLKST